MISALFTELTNIATAFVTFLAALFQDVVQIFWNAGSGSDPGSLTFVGTLMLIAIATGLVMWALYFIKNLIRIRRKA